jgi:flagellar biosynthesis/type III secretory pathway protein FliH
MSIRKVYFRKDAIADSIVQLVKEMLSELIECNITLNSNTTREELADALRVKLEIEEALELTAQP